MAKKPTKATSRALTTKQPQQPLAPIAGTNVIPDARYREPSRHPIRSGPWKDEFEKTAWTDPATGYPCIILRQPTGQLGGFVGVEPAHPLAGYKADALPPSVGEGLHRPLDYAEPCQGWQNERVSVCHVVHAPSRPSRGLHRGNAHEATADAQADQAWWFGMTMNGPTDLIPTLPGGRLGHSPQLSNEAKEQLEFLLSVLAAISRSIVSITETVIDLFGGQWHAAGHYGEWLAGQGLITRGSGITGAKLTLEGQAILVALASTRDPALAARPLGFAGLMQFAALKPEPDDARIERMIGKAEAALPHLPCQFVRHEIGNDPAIVLLGRANARLPFLATAGIVDAQTLPGPVRPSKVRLIAWTRRGAREPLAMALSMLGLRVLACDGAETVTCGDALADLFDTFDAIVDPPFPPEELPARLEELATGLILEPSRANVVAPPHGRALAWTILPEDGPGDHWWPPICAVTQTSAPTEPFPLGPPSDWRLFRDGRISVSFPADDLSTASPLPMDDTPWAIAIMEGWPIQMRKSRFPNFRDHLEERWPLTTPSSEMPAILGTFPGNRAMFRPDAVDHGALGAAVSLAPADAGNRPFRSGALASTRRFLHGCFEIEMRAARGPGLVTGFFLHRSAPRQEIDVEITGNNLRRVLLNVYFNPGDEGAALDYGYRGSPHSIDLEFDASEAFHRYAIEWSPDRIRWFVDDMLVHERGSWDPTPIPHLPMALHANLWAPRSVELAGAADPSLQKATAYFRNATVSDQPEQPGDTKCRRA